MPLQATSGAASYDAFGGGVPFEPIYIEQVFQNWLYTGNGSTQTITNGIDLAGKGGLVWSKIRGSADRNALIDSARGITKLLNSDATFAQATQSNMISSLSATGYVLGTDGTGQINASGYTYVSWTFRKQPKFFDVVTYTGDGANRTIAHNLGSAPGCIIIKRLNDTSNWAVWHRSGTQNNAFAAILNQTGGYADQGAPAFWGATGGTPNMNATTFSVGTSSNVNASGGTYVAYLFAHDAGGFGLTGTDNVISCGSYVGGGASPVAVDLGWEPQWILVKSTMTAYNWWIVDTMRGMVVGADDAGLQPNTTSAEQQVNVFSPTATGFLTGTNANANKSGDTFIYIAIRRGPMKVPTDATKVFVPVARTGNAGTATVMAGFPVDAAIIQDRQNPYGAQWFDRLRGAPRLLWSWTTAAEQTAYPNTLTGFDNQTGVYLGFDSYVNTLDQYINYFLRRAPGFFDEVCYTGTGGTQTLSHNLGVAPELMIVKSRAGIGRNWVVYISPMGNNYFACLNDGTFQGSSSTMWNDTTPTASVFTIGANIRTNNSGQTYVAYLFASCPGVSKVGSYTGTGAAQTINCGFTAGARFVLIKRTDSTGDWYVWDTARGMVSGTDPSLLLNSTAAEVNANSVYTTTGGFQIVSTAAGINASGGSYIFLAIA